MRSPVKPAVAVLCVHVVLPGAAVYGSGCPESSPCEQYWEADAVFVGTVTQLRCDEPPREPGRFRDEVELQVTEPFRGVSSRTVTIRTGACRDPEGLKAGRSYFVYAYRRGQHDTLTTSGCHVAELSGATMGADPTHARAGPRHHRVSTVGAFAVRGGRLSRAR